MTTTSGTDRWGAFREQQRVEIAAAIVKLVADANVPITIATIAEHAGLSRPTFYKYFPTLGAAMLHVHRHVIEEIMATASARVKEGHDGLSRLLNGVMALHDVAITKPELIRFTNYFDYTFRRHGLNSAESEELHRIERQWALPSVSAFRRGQEDGSIRKDVNPVGTADALGTSILGAVQRRVVSLDDGASVVATDQVIMHTLTAWHDYLKSR